MELLKVPFVGSVRLGPDGRSYGLEVKIAVFELWLCLCENLGGSLPSPELSFPYR